MSAMPPRPQRLRIEFPALVYMTTFDRLAEAVIPSHSHHSWKFDPAKLAGQEEVFVTSRCPATTSSAGSNSLMYMETSSRLDEAVKSRHIHQSWKFDPEPLRQSTDGRTGKI